MGTHKCTTAARPRVCKMPATRTRSVPGRNLRCTAALCREHCCCIERSAFIMCTCGGWPPDSPTHRPASNTLKSVVQGRGLRGAQKVSKTKKNLTREGRPGSCDWARLSFWFWARRKCTGVLWGGWEGGCGNGASKAHYLHRSPRVEGRAGEPGRRKKGLSERKDAYIGFRPEPKAVLRKARGSVKDPAKYECIHASVSRAPYPSLYPSVHNQGGGGGDGHDIRRNKCKHIVELRSRSFDDRCPVHSDNVCAGVCVYGKRSASGRTCAGWVVWFSNAFSGLSGHLDDQATPFLSHCVIRVFRASAAVEPFSWEFVPGRTCDTNEKWVL